MAPRTFKRFVERMTRLYEQGAGTVRIGEYAQRWWRSVRAGLKDMKMGLVELNGLFESFSSLNHQDLLHGLRARDAVAKACAMLSLMFNTLWYMGPGKKSQLYKWTPPPPYQFVDLGKDVPYLLLNNNAFTVRAIHLEPFASICVKIFSTLQKIHLFKSRIENPGLWSRPESGTEPSPTYFAILIIAW